MENEENSQCANEKDEVLDRLRQEIMRGVKDIEEGRFTVLNDEAELEALSDEIIRRGQERLNASRK